MPSVSQTRTRASRSSHAELDGLRAADGRGRGRDENGWSHVAVAKRKSAQAHARQDDVTIRAVSPRTSRVPIERASEVLTRRFGGGGRGNASLRGERPRAAAATGVAAEPDVPWENMAVEAPEGAEAVFVPRRRRSVAPRAGTVGLGKQRRPAAVPSVGNGVTERSAARRPRREQHAGRSSSSSYGLFSKGRAGKSQGRSMFMSCYCAVTLSLLRGDETVGWLTC